MIGIAAEYLIQNLIARERRIQPLQYSTSQLLSIARASSVGRQRLEAAKPHLIREYGIPIRVGKSFKYQLEKNFRCKFLV